MSTTEREAALHAINMGSKYPYDSPDKEGNQPRPARDWAHVAARGVLADLTDRRGIKSGFYDIDETVREEIVDSLAAIIRHSGSPSDDTQYKSGIREGLRIAAQTIQAKIERD